MNACAALASLSLVWMSLDGLTPTLAGRIFSAMRNAIVAVGMLLSVLAGSLTGQTSTGGLSGTITDPAGAVVAGARLTLTNLRQPTERKQRDRVLLLSRLASGPV